MDILGTVLTGIAQNQLWFFAALLLVVLVIIAVMAVILLRAGRGARYAGSARGAAHRRRA